MSTHRALLASVLVFASCGSPSMAVPSASAGTETPAATDAAQRSSQLTASSGASPTPQVMGFPDVQLIAGNATGDLQVYRSGAWSVEAKICASADSSNPVTALEVVPPGQRVFAQCGRASPGSADPDARDAFVYDFATKQRRAVSGTSAAGV